MIATDVCADVVWHINTHEIAIAMDSIFISKVSIDWCCDFRVGGSVQADEHRIAIVNH